MEKTLKVTLKKKWFDMEFHPDPEQRKDEEYREFNEYWYKRLVDRDKLRAIKKASLAIQIAAAESEESLTDTFWDHVKGSFEDCFKSFGTYHAFNGGYFGDQLPNGIRECKGIRVDEGKPEWGAEPGVKYFVISLGEIIK